MTLLQLQVAHLNGYKAIILEMAMSVVHSITGEIKSDTEQAITIKNTLISIII